MINGQYSVVVFSKNQKILTAKRLFSKLQNTKKELSLEVVLFNLLLAIQFRAFQLLSKIYFNRFSL